MLSSSCLARNAQQAARRSGVQALQRRAYAAAASSASFETGDVSGLKVASRDLGAPTTKLAVVAKAGTRYQPLPGLSAGLAEFAFKSTKNRSALRIQREAELLGGQLGARVHREALILEASFLRDDLPYFAELLAEVVSSTKYTTHEFHEEVETSLRLKQAAAQYDAAAIALDNAYAVAFHNGLGSPVFPASTAPYKKYLSDDHVAAFADAAYTRPNLAIVGDGANASTLSSWVERFFKDVPVSAQSGQSIKTEATKYFGGEQRQNAAVGNAITIAFPGSDYNNAKPEIAVLAALLGGKSTIKWSPGFSLLGKATAGLPDLQVATSNASYSDAGLFTIQISGAAASVRKAAFEAAKALKSVADGTVGKEDLEKAIANAKFDALNDSQLREPSTILAGAGLLNTGKPFELNALSKAIEGVTAQKLKTAAKALVDGKATVSAVGDLFVLPYAEEIGLQV
jgi:ubiquinol-cytochrome c reductase core subunit 2